MTYIEELSQNGSTYLYKTPSDLENQWQPTAWWYWYVDGNVEIEPGSKRDNNQVRNLTVQDDQVLFINGNLTMHKGTTIYGNVVVNGNLTINGHGNSKQGIRGTIYVNGNVTIDKNLKLGTVGEPSFVFAEGDIKLGNKVSGYGYFLSDTFEGKQENITITGGVYTFTASNLPPSGITENKSFNEDKLYDYAIPSQVTVNSTEENPSSEGITTFKYSSPKLN